MNNFYIWEGIYSSFDEAEIAIEQNLDIFNEKLWIQNINRDIKVCINSIQSNISIPSFYKQRTIILPAVISLIIEKKEKLNILDFGGGLGIGYLSLKESLFDQFKNIKYFIIELDNLVVDGKEIYYVEHPTKCLFEKNIFFYNKIPKNLLIDIIYISSSIQYIRDWKSLITKFVNIKPQYLFFSDVFAGNIPTFVTLQNYYNHKVQHWFFNYSEFVSFVENLGYKLILKQTVTSLRANSANILPMDNFPESHRLNETLHLLFIKI